MDYTVYQLLWLFLFYSFLGWLAETVLAALKRRRLLNRGFLSPPSLPPMAWGRCFLPFFCLNCGKTHFSSSFWA